MSIFACQNIIDVPKPVWREDVNDLKRIISHEYQAKDVQFSTPFVYRSKDDKDYWLRVSLLNPKRPNSTFTDVAKDVAIKTLQHLQNYEKFKKIEINIVQAQEGPLVIKVQRSMFFKCDSLINASK
jgi:hypothetical protein